MTSHERQTAVDLIYDELARQAEEADKEKPGPWTAFQDQDQEAEGRPTLEQLLEGLDKADGASADPEVPTPVVAGSLLAAFAIVLSVGFCNRFAPTFAPIHKKWLIRAGVIATFIVAVLLFIALAEEKSVELYWVVFTFFLVATFALYLLQLVIWFVVRTLANELHAGWKRLMILTPCIGVIIGAVLVYMDRHYRDDFPETAFKLLLASLLFSAIGFLIVVTVRWVFKGFESPKQ